jgi:hypothetical protein
MKVFALDADEWSVAEKNGLTKDLCEATLQKTVRKASTLLPTLSTNLNVLIRANVEGAVADIAVGGFTYDSELVMISFDESLPFGKPSLIKHLHSTLLHETNHAARFAWIAKEKKYEKSLVDWAIWEGLATVFERDYGKTVPKWAKYKDEATMRLWLIDLQQADKNKDAWEEWAFKRKDGRHWLAYRVGTWIIDRAINNSSKTVVDLTITPAKEILRLANI